MKYNYRFSKSEAKFILLLPPSRQASICYIPLLPTLRIVGSIMLIRKRFLRQISTLQSGSMVWMNVDLNTIFIEKPFIHILKHTAKSYPFFEMNSLFLNNCRILLNVARILTFVRNPLYTIKYFFFFNTKIYSLHRKIYSKSHNSILLINLSI